MCCPDGTNYFYYVDFAEVQLVYQISQKLWRSLCEVCYFSCFCVYREYQGKNSERTLTFVYVKQRATKGQLASILRVKLSR